MKNWTVKEAVKVISEGKDLDAIKEVVKHFPLFAVIAASKDFDAFAAAMPEHLTVRKVENELNNGTTNSDDDDVDAEDVNDEDASAESGSEDLSSMSKAELIKLCEKRGIKVQKYQKPKQYYIDALTEGGDADGAGEEETDEPADAEDPITLYKKCKKAGLKVAPKKSVKYYKDALKKAEQEAEDEANGDTDDWDDDDTDDWDDEDEKPAKKVSKPAGKKSKAKAEPEPDDEDDEDEGDEDEWDI